MKPIVYHNPRCSKSRETVKLLEDSQIDCEMRLYLDDVPTVDELKSLLSLLGFSSARDLMRVKESVYKELNLAAETNENALLQAMADYPKLIERPIVVTSHAAKIGRPPKSVLELFH